MSAEREHQSAAERRIAVDGLPPLLLRRSPGGGPIRIEVEARPRPAPRRPRIVVRERPEPYTVAADAGHVLYPAAETPAAAVSQLAGDVSLNALEYVVVDVETTGGAAARDHRITEVALVRVTSAGRVLEEFHTLVNPCRPIPPFVSRLTNITQRMVERAPRFEQVTEEVERLLRGRVFVAHNAGFDRRFLATELERAGMVAAHGQRLICTVKLARRVLPEVRRRTLDSLAYYFDVEIEHRHRAFGDARATAQVFARLLQRAEDQDVRHWGTLQALIRRRRPRGPRRRSALPTSMDSID
ncbi:MAG: 3'-5' exonuclease [Longimicrobiales bacterium]